MRTIAVSEFVRRLAERLRDPDQRVVWFLGAGCSVSSGIPAAGGVVTDWLPRLARLEADVEDWKPWADAKFAKWRSTPSVYYADVMERLFHTPTDRQQEVERLVRDRDPAVGYATLAQLMAHDEFGSSCNVALTTNFDDLVGDALYLCTRRKPRVIPHEALVGFVRATNVTPLVVKVHGDAHLAPRNVASETNEIPKALRRSLTPLLHQAHVVILGYSGGDGGIADWLNGMAEDHADSVCWVNASDPTETKLGPWFARLGPRATWVRDTDFDGLFISLNERLGLGLPDLDRFDRLRDSYRASLVNEAKTSVEPTPPERAVGDAAARLLAKLDAWTLERRAREASSVQADEFYRNAIELTGGDDPEILTRYAVFLWTKARDIEGAEAMYERAVAADPDNGNTLGNYALFLHQEKRDSDRAEAMSLRAIAADPENSDVLGSYAEFLSEARDDRERAEAMYERAIAADPQNSRALGGYALLLQRGGKDPSRVEAMYASAIEADPGNATCLGHYALFLAERGDLDRAEDMYERAILVEPEHAPNLGNYALFLSDQREDPDRADAMYVRALEVDPESAHTLGNYALFLHYNGSDPESAEAMSWRALDANPHNANVLGNLAVFLYQVREDPDSAEAMFERAIAADMRNAASLGHYASFLHQVRKDPGRAEAMYERAIEADPHEPSNLANYTGLLLAFGRDGGFQALERATKALTRISSAGDRETIALELAFYRWAHDSDACGDALGAIRALIDSGVRSPGWDLSANVAQAATTRDASAELIARVAAVISEGADPTTLLAFSAWREAG